MRVLIDARLPEGDFGGVQQTILGLASGLSRLDDADDEFRFLVRPDHGWLAPGLGGPCTALVTSQVAERGGEAVERLRRRSSVAGQLVGHLIEGRCRVLPGEDPVVRRADPDLVHFMLQRGFRTSRPNVWQPHDLQHVLLPELWHPLNRAYRHIAYRAMARQADRVGVMTSDAVADVRTHLRVPSERIVVVPWASVLSLAPATGDSAAPVVAAGVPDRYLLFPAQTRAHKNHVRLLRALGLLRREGLEVPLVLTGRRMGAWPQVAAVIAEEGLCEQVWALDYVDEALLGALYERAQALVFPSLFEGWGLPLVEAFEAGTAVVCSDLSPLREIAAGAAELVDPLDPSSIASGIRRVWEDPEHRERLRTAGRARSAAFSWDWTARRFRAVYRDVLGAKLSGEDRDLLTRSAPV